ncbi:MAG: ribosome maturation factor RimM [Thermodesulfobacteriota bacterium]|nr:ribosome maturation factor RimM [Thermodesulfobacteriota bacterium]
MKEDFLIIGKIVSTHGLRGKLRVISYNDSNEIFSTQRIFYVKDINGSLKEYTLIRIESHKKVLLAEFDGISSIDKASELIGAYLLIHRSRLNSLSDDEYYWFEIVGIKVFTDGGTLLGEVRRIIQTGSNDVYVVCNKEKEYLIPAINDVITSIDLTKRVMIIHPVEGLLGDDKI